MDTGITLIQECERIQSIFQNTTWGIKNELRRTMGSLPLCSIPTQQNLMRNPTFNPSGKNFTTHFLKRIFRKFG